MRSFCCILFIISFVTIALADVPISKKIFLKVSEMAHLCDIEVLRNLTSEVGATNGILRSGSDNLNTRMERVENDLNDIKTDIRGINEIKANGQRLSEAHEAEKTVLERFKNDLDDIRASIRDLSEIKASVQHLSEALDKNFMPSSSCNVLVEGQSKIQRLENDLQNMNTKIERLLEGSNKIYFPSSCFEALKTGKPSGIYRLHIPLYNLEPFDVYCMEDPDKGPAWTVIQRRQDGSVDFNRDWESYKNGFGNLTGEFWIGLDRIHAMTSYQPNSLWIKLGDFNNETASAKYEKFAISGERENYTLSTLGSFSGNVGDSLTQHLNMKFSTKDRDNDVDPKVSCAKSFKGGWWYHDCFNSNLNGQYKTINIKGKCISWNIWGDHNPLKYSHMAIRPIN